MLVIGLTGGIASGKSVVSTLFAILGAEIIDTDEISRELVAPGEPLLAELVARFGEAVLQADGSLNRRALREKVFADAAARKQLEDLLHPAIRARVAERLRESSAPYCIVVIPLLAETRYPYALDRVLVVDADPADQLSRLQARDGIDSALAEAMLAAQASREKRLALADDVLVNNTDLASLRSQVTALHALYRQLAEKGPLH